MGWFAVSWLTIAVAALALSRELWRFWGTSADYTDRFLIPLASLWLVYRQWDTWKQLPIRSQTVGFVPLLIGWLATIPAWFLLVQVGPRVILLWWLTSAVVLMMAGLVWIQFGWPRLRAILFPLGFVFFSLPLPNRIEIYLQPALQELATASAAHSLSWVGIPVQRLGFQLHLPNGDLEVVEACSGIRSLTALTAIAAFVAHLREFGFWRGVLLVLLALPVVALCNGVRIFLTGVLQEYVDKQAVQGLAHDALGASMVVLGLGLILWIAHLIRPRNREAVPSVVTKFDAHLPSRWQLLLANTLCGLGFAGSALVCWYGLSITQERIELVPLTGLSTNLAGWQAEEQTIPTDVTEKLTYDQALHRVYRNSVGQEIHVWVLFWQATSAIKGYHHPDICWPNHGWQNVRKDTQPFSLEDSIQLPVTVREFQRGRNRQRILYWTQEGQRIWDQQDEGQSHAAGPSHNWIVDRLFDPKPRQTARLSILIGANLWGSGDYAEQQVDQFAKLFAQNLYEVCSWAKPEGLAK